MIEYRTRFGMTLYGQQVPGTNPTIWVLWPRGIENFSQRVAFPVRIFFWPSRPRSSRMWCAIFSRKNVTLWSNAMLAIEVCVTQVMIWSVALSWHTVRGEGFAAVPQTMKSFLKWNKFTCIAHEQCPFAELKCSAYMEWQLIIRAAARLSRWRRAVGRAWRWCVPTRSRRAGGSLWGDRLRPASTSRSGCWTNSAQSGQGTLQ